MRCRAAASDLAADQAEEMPHPGKLSVRQPGHQTAWSPAVQHRRPASREAAMPDASGPGRHAEPAGDLGLTDAGDNSSAARSRRLGPAAFSVGPQRRQGTGGTSKIRSCPAARRQLTH